MTVAAPHHRAGVPAAATGLCAEIDAAPHAGLLVDVVGPGGCGKTPLLEEAARRYRAAKVPVVWDPQVTADLSESAVLVDDAHLLDDPTLDRLRRLATGPGQRLLVAHRRWPACPALIALGSVLATARPPLVLGHLDRNATADRASALLGARCPELLTRLLYEQTAGLPVLLDQVVVGLRDSGQITADLLRRPLPGTTFDVPAGVREQVRYVVEALPAEVRQVLFAATLGLSPDTRALAELLAVDAAVVDDVLRAAAASGLLTDDGAVVPLVGRLLVRLVPPAQASRVCEVLAGVRLRCDGSMVAFGRGLLDTGARGPNTAAALVAAGDEALGSVPELAAELYTAAEQAGAAARPLLVRRADAAARGGRFDAALRLADEAVRDEHGAQRARALDITAAVLAHRGLLSRAAELSAAASAGAGRRPMHAVPALVGIGAVAEAQHAVAGAEQCPDGAVSLLDGVEALVARGVLDTLDGSPVTALSRLTRAATLLESAGSTPLLPETPAALAGLVAVHAGEFAAAESVLRRAVSARLGGPAAVARHMLLLAFLAAVRGHVTEAHALLDRVDAADAPTAAAAARRALEPRDELFAAAARVGVARREGDLAALRSGWSRAREALIRHPVDLYMLLPLGELGVAAARLREQWWIDPHLRQAEALLDRLGRPVLWRVPLHWYGVHAAIAAESPDEARRHASALAEAATEGPYPAVLAAAAACWLRVLAGTADVEVVVATARRLGAAGLGAEGARLAGQAAIRATDRRDMTVLLECARTVQPDTATRPDTPPVATAGVPQRAPELGSDGAGPTRAAPAAASPSGAWTGAEPSARLSDRELEIARLVLTGRNYKAIGAQLFISPKTVEHHVARMRRRLGATSRQELFEHLRVVLRGSDTGGGS